jgi:hypothetical protein
VGRNSNIMSISIILMKFRQPKTDAFVTSYNLKDSSHNKNKELNK